ncbi:MAG: right-handed parallel beta-helix repeat-containing protein [Dyadobacter sp.]|uniref:right-handed parallel beta-helix repeat-containing protein n=1 Tax=Dyadobacter sp. TaxID=1914288 RepID=UPI0032673538
MKKSIGLLLCSLLFMQAFAQVPDTLTPEKNARWKIGRIRDNSVRAITPIDFRNAFNELANISVTRVPYLSMKSVRQGKADTARVINVTDVGREGQFVLDASDVSTADDSSMTIINSGKRYKRKYDGQTVNASWFGLIGDGDGNGGGTNETAILKKAILYASSQKVKLFVAKPKAAAYNITDMSLTNVSDINLEGDNVVFDMKNGTTTSNGIISVRNTLAGYPTVKLFASPAAKGAYQFTLDDVGGMQVGDFILIRSTSEVFDIQRPTSNVFKTEFAEVTGVDTGTKIVTIKGTLWDSYAATTTQVYKMTYNKNLSIKGITFKGAGKLAGQAAGISIDRVRNLRLTNVTVEGFAIIGVGINNSVNVNIQGCNFSKSQASGTGYGIQITGMLNGIVANNFFSESRHAVDITGGYISRNVQLSGNIANDCDASAFSSHGGSENISVLNNMMRDCGGGIIMRGRGTQIIGNRIIGYSHTNLTGVNNYATGIIVGDSGDHVPGVGFAGTDLVIERNYIENPQFGGMVIYSPLLRAKISNNTIVGSKTEGILMNGLINRYSSVEGNIIDCSLQSDSLTGYGIRHYPIIAATGNNLTGFSVNNNKIINPYMVGVMVTGGTGVSDYSTDVTVRNNEVLNARHYSLVLLGYINRLNVVGNTMINTKSTIALGNPLNLVRNQNYFTLAATPTVYENDGFNANTEFTGITTLGSVSLKGSIVPAVPTTSVMGSNGSNYAEMYTKTILSNSGFSMGTTNSASAVDIRQGITTSVLARFQATTGNLVVQAPGAAPAENNNRFTVVGTSWLNGVVKLSSVPVFADNAAATTGGLATGTVYRTTTGEVRIVF